MLLRTALAGSLLATTALAQLPNVLVVDDDGGPGVDFTHVADAVNAAADGDVLLIRSGSYIGFPFGPEIVIDAKSLSLFAEGDVDVPSIQVTNLALGQEVVLRGVDLRVGVISGQGNEGTIWVEDSQAVVVDGEPLQSFGYTSWFDCDAVVLNRCTHIGTPALTLFNDPALRATLSSVHVYDSHLTGGAGFIHVGTFTPGAPGCWVNESFAFLSGTTLEQGVLGNEDGFQISSNSSSILLETTGTWTIEGGTQTVLPEVARSFEATAIAREGEQVTFTWDGPADELAILNLSASPSALYLAPFLGSGVIGLPLLTVQAAGVIPASGSVSLSLPVPTLNPALEGLVLYSQGSFANLTTGAIRVGGGSAFLLLDQSF